MIVILLRTSAIEFDPTRMNSNTFIGAAIGSARQRTKAIGHSSGFEAGASPNFIELAYRTPSDWICDPSVEFGFMPACAVGADLELGRERAISDLAVDRRPGQPGPGEDGL